MDKRLNWKTLIIYGELPGRLGQVEQTLQQAFPWTTRHHCQQLPLAGVFYVRLGNLRCEQNDLVAAEESLNQAIQLAQFGTPIIAARAQAFLSRVKQAQDDTAAAEMVWQQVEQLSHGRETG